MWKIKIPLRIKIFMWLAARNKVLTAEILQKRGWNGPSICVLCNSNTETLDHILFQCNYAKSLWRGLLHNSNTTQRFLITVSGNLADRWRQIRSTVSGISKSYLDLCFAAAYWELWNERNRRIFNDRQGQCNNLRRSVLYSADLWKLVLHN